MSLDEDILEPDDGLTSLEDGFLARKNRAHQAWKEIRARLPENLPLPRGIIVARVVVVFSIVLFAGYSVFTVLRLSPLRDEAEVQASWHDQVSLNRRWLTEALVAEGSSESFDEELGYLKLKLQTLVSGVGEAAMVNDQSVAEARTALGVLEDLKAKETHPVALLDVLESLQRSFRTEENRLRSELDSQSDVQTFLVAGALVLCCVTLLLMEQSNRAKEKVASLRFRATHDPLTHGLNRAAILSLAAKELNRAKRVGKELAIFLVDMDHFKLINDRYGHPTGDSVIKQTATRLRRNVRVYDAVGRYGGDEFLVVLPNCDLKDAEIIAERLRVAFEVPMDLGQAKKKVSICIGGAIYRSGDVDVESLILRADQALYRAKESGRNGWAIKDAPIPNLEKPEPKDEIVNEAEA